jgi:minor extracellular serine protease Vpr
MRRLVVFVAALALLIPGGALAQEPERPYDLQPAPVQGPLDVELLPLSLDDSRRVTAMLKMRGEPVAVAQGRAPQQRLAPGQKEQIKRELQGRQDAIKGQIAGLGSEVLGQYQIAYNGIKVDAPRNRLNELAALPGVEAVKAIEEHHPGNADSVPWIGAPGVWDDLDLTGEGISIAIIDTGIDYTHANFGGPGTVEAFEQAEATSTEPADPALFGPDAPKVKGGFDFVGDDYNAGDPENDVPQPDPNPLDCNGHGSHVGGTAAGFGVNADGTTYTGPYDGTTHENAFRIGPGVAPEADLYALRVFGCAGSTQVTVDAIEWAVDNEVDVINMSLGAVFGRPDDPSAEASNNAALAGVIVVVSAGNSGAQHYITGSPSVGTRTIAVAGQDTIGETPGVLLELSDAGGDPIGSIVAQNSNDAELPDGTELEVVVLRDGDGQISLGCEPDDYDPAVVADKLVVTHRGVCARVARAVFGEQAGAAAVAMINDAAGYPPFEGPITSNPDTGEQFVVTIPFLGIQGPGQRASASPHPDALAIEAADDGSAVMTNTGIDNPNFTRFAGFSSSGARRIDSWLKPDITAPGVSIQSTLIGSGDAGTRVSGTSMAAPHVAGVAALTLQAHPGWDVEDLKAAIVNTGDPGRIGQTDPPGSGTGFRISRGGTGLVQPALSTQTSVVAVGNPGTASLSFGFEELASNYSEALPLTVRNHGDSPATFSLGTSGAAGSPHSVTLSVGSATVPAGGETIIDVTLEVPAASVAQANLMADVAGFVTLTAVAGSNAGIDLRVPYYLAVRGLSDVSTTLNRPLTPGQNVTARVTNDGPRAGDADFFQWGLSDPNDGLEQNDLRAVGTQAWDFPGLGRMVTFAINTWTRWDNNAVDEYDILIDSTGDGEWDHAVVGIDFGLVSAGLFNGQMASITVDLETGQAAAWFLANYRFNNGVTLLHVPAAAIGLSEANSDFTYSAAAFSLRDGTGDDFIDGTARFDAWTPAIDGFDSFVGVGSGQTVETVVPVSATGFAHQRPLGLMVVSADDAAGESEAQLISRPGPPAGPPPRP